jgi:uncharacterized protein YjbI with pentapeptide repeats
VSKSRVLSKETVTQGDYSRLRLDKLTIIGSRFVDSRFEDLRVRDMCFGSGRVLSEYLRCSFDRSVMGSTSPGWSRFVECSFKDVELEGWFCHNASFLGCTFTGRLRKCVFFGAPPADSFRAHEQNEYRDNDFSGAELVDVAFRRGVDLSKQRLPGGPDYIYLPGAATTLERVRAALVVSPDLQTRGPALAFLQGWERDVENGQDQLLIRPVDFGFLSRDVTRTVFDLMRANA